MNRRQVSMFDRIRTALRKRWERYGSGPATFILNRDHWHELYYDMTEHNHPIANSWWTGTMDFMGTTLMNPDRMATHIEWLRRKK